MASAALEATERTRARAPESPEAFLALHGYYAKDLLASGAGAHLALGQPELSLERYERVVALDPRSARLWNSMSNALLLLRRYQESGAAPDRALPEVDGVITPGPDR